MSKFLIGILFLIISLISSASGPKDKKSYNLLTFKQIEAECPWLQSGNAAGLSLMEELFPAELKLGFNLNDGDFHSVFNGQSVQTFEFGSQSYRKINKTYLYGSFNYSKSFERGLNFSNNNDLALNYPYLLVDTIGNDTYEREFFNLTGIISSPVNNNLNWGLSFDYKVGVAAQNRDPRPENKVMQTNISPGLLFSANHFRFGANLTYGYYNEDIEVSVVESGAQQTLFLMHGPGIFSFHSSNSFNRLYRQQKLGGGMQFGWIQGKISNLLHSDFVYTVQTIDDGRRASGATWAAVKNDARLDRTNWNLTDVLSVHQGKKVHQLKSALNLNSKLGTEFIQRLEKVNETDLEHWITYGKEQKYYSLQTNAGLNYQLISKDENSLMKSAFNAAVNYSAFKEEYYLPDKNQYFSNMMVGVSYLKLFVFQRSSVLAEMNFNYQFNLNRRQNLMEDHFMVQKIFRPEFNYLTKSYLSPGISLGYEVPIKKMFSKYFVKTDFDRVYSASALNQILFRFSTGLIF